MTAESPESFATLLRHFRQAAGLTQDELADRSRVSARTISDLERGLNAPRKTTLVLLADALQLAGADRRRLSAAARGESGDVAPSASSSAALPIYLTRLIGRDADTTAILDVIAHQHRRLVTLTGTAGIGKTRLAVGVAAHLTDVFPDGILFIPLAQVQEWRLIPNSIAQVLGIQEEPGQSLWDLITMTLATKTALLILDNLEHLLEGGAFVVDLLSACPALTILVTSRAALRVRGEQRYPVPPLDASPAKEPGERSVAEELFIERAQEIQPHLPLTPANLESIAAICRRLEGIPLAIELAAMRVAAFTPPELLRHLDHQLSLLVAGSRDLPPRQQTMRDAVAWSYDLLSPQEQSLFRRLSVFVGGWTLAAAQAVCIEDGPPDLLLTLVMLVDANLIQFEPGDDHDEESRYTMLEVLREYGLEQLEAHGERESAQRRHAEYVLTLAHTAGEGMRGPDQSRWLARLDEEQGNQRAALQWARARDVKLGLAIATALWRYWYVRHYLSEGRSWLETFLQSTYGQEGIEELQAQANLRAGSFATEEGDLVRAKRFFEASILLYQQINDVLGMCNALNAQGNVAFLCDLYEEAEGYYRQALMQNQVPDNISYRATTLANLAMVATAQGRYQESLTLLEECCAVKRKLGDPHQLAVSLINLSNLLCKMSDYARSVDVTQEAYRLGQQIHDQKIMALALGNKGKSLGKQGNYPQAREALEQSYQLLEELHNTLGLAAMCRYLGDISCEQKDWQQATAYYSKGVNLSWQLGTPLSVVKCLVGMSRALQEQGYLELAAQYGGKASAMCANLDLRSQARISARLDDLQQTLQKTLDREAFQAAWEQGKALSIEDLPSDL